MRGETVAAFVALAEDAGPAEAALAAIEAACEQRLAGYKRPRTYLLRESIPRDGTGKLLRAPLRAELWRGRSNFAAPSARSGDAGDGRKGA
jgi:long-chain acyl-CoA synthetase